MLISFCCFVVMCDTCCNVFVVWMRGGTSNSGGAVEMVTEAMEILK